MKYLGTYPQEGLVLLANSTVSGVTSVAFDNVFSSAYDIYFFEIYDYEQATDGNSLFFDFTADGSVISGTINRGGIYDYPGYNLGWIGTWNDTVAEISNGNVGNATGEGAFLWGWLVPQTANNKIMSLEMSGVDVGGGTQHNIQGMALESATLCNGIDFKTDSGNMAGEFRFYGLGKRRNKLKSINQANRTTNFVSSHYMGASAKTDGQGWILVVEATATDDDSAMEFQECFNGKHDLYKIVMEDMRPKTDNQDLVFQWLVDSTAQTGTYTQTSFAQDGLGQDSSSNDGNVTGSVIVENVGTNTRESATGMLYCNPQSTNAKTMIGRAISQMADGYTRAWHSATDYTTKTTAYNGIKFLWASGNFETGTVRIYGRQS
jgi:hypothetical protein